MSDRALHILLVEDDPDDVELLQTAFEDNHVAPEFTVIYQGDKVLPYLEETGQLPDTIVLDLNLPKLHGKEILQLLALSPYGKIPVIVLTTSSSKADIDFCMSLGVKHYETKPTSMRDYYSICDKILSVANASA